MKIFRFSPCCHPGLRAGIYALLLLFTASASAITTETGKSFFAPQSLSTMLEPLSMNMQQFAHETEPAERFTLSVAPFYIKSNNSKDLRHYFFPEGKDELVIKGSEAPGRFDVSGTWLKIAGTNAAHAEAALLDNDFQSTLQINPVYEYLGANIQLRKHIERVWIEVQLPIAQAKVDHELNEFNLSGNVNDIDAVDMFDSAAAYGLGKVLQENPTTLYSISAVDALSQRVWEFNKLSKKKIKAAGVGDTIIKIGVGGAHGSVFAKVILPTSQKPTNEFMFEPQLGNGGHLGLGFGGRLVLSTEVEQLAARVGLLAEADYTHLFANHQMRTFDMEPYGVFSRYLMMKSATPNTEPWFPGVNMLSKKCEISPHGTATLGFHGFFKKNKLYAAVGYNLHHRQQESIDIVDAFEKKLAVSHASGCYEDDHAVFYLGQASIPAIAMHGNAGSRAGVGGDPRCLVNPEKIITLDMLDRATATRPSSTTNFCSLSVGFDDRWHGQDMRLGLSGGLSVGAERTALATWMVALQLSLAL